MQKLLALTLALGLMAASPAQKTMADVDKLELKMLAGLEAKTKVTRVAYTKSPKNAKNKAAFVRAAFDEAEKVLVSPALGPKKKYPRSLRLYREVVRADPSHKKAKDRIAQIESIYKQMGLPIPK